MKRRWQVISSLALLLVCSCTRADFPDVGANGPCIVRFDGNRPTLAIWEDGVFLTWPTPDREDFCLIGRYDSNEVASVLAAVDKSGFLQLPETRIIVPDADWTEIYVLFHGKARQHAWHEYLNPGFGGDLNTDAAYRRFVWSWMRTEGAIASLAPVEIHRSFEVKGVKGLSRFRGVDMKSPRKTEWPKAENTSNKASEATSEAAPSAASSAPQG